jgi:hypothetical protein
LEGWVQVKHLFLFLISLGVFSKNCVAQEFNSASVLSASDKRSWSYFVGTGVGGLGYSANGSEVNRKYGNPMAIVFDIGFLKRTEFYSDLSHGALMRLVSNFRQAGGILERSSSHLTSLFLGYHLDYKIPIEKVSVRSGIGLFGLSWGDSKYSDINGTEYRNTFNAETRWAGFIGLGYRNDVEKNDFGFQFAMDLMLGRTGRSIVGPISAGGLLLTGSLLF